MTRTVADLKKIAKEKGVPLYSTMSRDELESALSTTPYDIGWRWKYIKPQLVKPSEGKTVMNMLLSPVRDLEAYPDVVDWLKSHKVYITLTTSPMRLPKLRAVLATLDYTHLAKIYVVLPYRYGHKKKPYNDKDIARVAEFPLVTVIRTAKDYGPLTKMLPVIRRIRDKRSIIISIDDDVAYPMGMINEMIYTKVVKHPNAVVEPGPGLNIRSFVGNFGKRWPQGRPRKPYTDIVEGWMGIAYSGGVADTKLMEKLSRASKQCYLSDDLVISFVLASMDVPRVTIDNKYMYHPMPYEYGTGDDALHKGGGTGKAVKVGAHSDEYNFEKYNICLNDIQKK